MHLTTLNALFPLFHSVKDFLDAGASGAATDKLTFDLMTFREHAVMTFTDDAGQSQTLTTDDLALGLALSRATVLSLGIMPYISARIMFQLLAAVFPTVEKMQKRIDYDLSYVENWSLALDLLILWKTARAVLSSSGAY